MDLSRREFIGLSAGFATIGIAGCSSKPTVQKDTQATTETKDKKEAPKATLEVTDSGFYTDEYGNAHYAAKITNSSTKYAASTVKITVTAKDSGGKILETMPYYLSAIYPSGDAFIGGVVPTSEKANSVEFAIADDEDTWKDTEQTQKEYIETFYAENVNVVNSSYPSVTGEAVSKSKHDF